MCLPTRGDDGRNVASGDASRQSKRKTERLQDFRTKKSRGIREDFGWQWLNHGGSATAKAGEGGKRRAQFLARWEVTWRVLKKWFGGDNLGSCG